MTKLVYLIKRRADLTPAEFQRLWLEKHAKFADRLKSVTAAKGYKAFFAEDTACNACFRYSRHLGGPHYDAVLVLEWDSLEDYQAGFGSPAGLRLSDEMVEAESKFVDFKSSTAFLMSTQDVLASEPAALPARKPAAKPRAKAATKTTERV